MQALSTFDRKSKEYKLHQCKNVIEAFLAACGPATMQELVQECRTQAVAPGYMVQAINSLKNDSVIYFDAEYYCFDLN